MQGSYDFDLWGTPYPDHTFISYLQMGLQLTVQCTIDWIFWSSSNFDFYPVATIVFVLADIYFNWSQWQMHIVCRFFI